MNENYKTNSSIGTEKRGQMNYTERAKAQKTQDLHCTPDIVLTAAQATAGFLVVKGSICRVFGTITDLVGFYSTIPGSVPAVTDQNVAMLGATVVTFIASNEFIRTTSGVTRVEVTLDS